MNDNAGGGFRGIRPTPRPSLFRLLSERFGLRDANAGRNLGGSSNLNWFFRDGSQGYVARVYRPSVTLGRLQAIQHVRQELAQSGLPFIQAVPDRDGATWAMWGNHPIEVERFVPHDGVMDTWERVQRGLPYLGRIHTQLQNLTVSPEGQSPRFANYLTPADTLFGTFQGLERVRAWQPSLPEKQIITAASELAQRVCAAEPSAQSLPQQLVHGDFWDNNVFFQGSDIVLVTDLDFMGERTRVDDLALSLYFAAATFLKGTNFSAQAQHLRLLVDAYDSGLTTPLTTLERATLPLLLARQPLWWIGFWLVTLDDNGLARQGFSEQAEAVAWALQITDHLSQWQAIFA